MRWVTAIAAVIVLTGCGGGEKPGTDALQPPKVETTCAAGVNCPEGARTSWRHCSHASRGYRACTVGGFPRGERSWIQHREGTRWKTVVPPRVRQGWWRRIVTSPDRKTLLAQWSGECEIQSTYLVSTENGKARSIFHGNSSTAVGWSEDGRARVRLPAPLSGMDRSTRFQAGIYLVDPETMAISRERSIAKRPGC